MSEITQNNTRTKELIEIEDRYGAHNYHPLPVVLEKGEGVYLWDVEGKKYLDFLSAYSAVNQGHCHPRIIGALSEQAKKLTLTSRAFHSDQLGAFCKYAGELFGYDRVIMMNSGVEAVETAIKLCRKWGYLVKGIDQGAAKIVFANNNFHGRTLGVVSASTDESARKDFGPFLPGILNVPYDDLSALEELFVRESSIAGFIVEPIQGEAGVVLPSEGYLQGVRDLCSKFKVLYIADEIQTGIARTGSMLASYDIDDPDRKSVQPDILLLGKAISGGVMPISAVLANDEVMLTLKPGEHGSTFGGNPLACAVAKEALSVVLDEALSSNALKMGQLFRDGLVELSAKHPLIKLVRGKGLLNAIVIDSDEDSLLAWNICMTFKENGLLAKPTHGNKIRLAPPLVITEEQVSDALSIIDKSFQVTANLQS
ncbi:MAG: ornithine--oxo-acid transaminase [Pedobacter sp.]|nr:MAG: ornithine--oxo-acid transaminase [Pedobacter sp.]